MACALLKACNKDWVITVVPFDKQAFREVRTRRVGKDTRQVHQLINALHSGPGVAGSVECSVLHSVLSSFNLSLIHSQHFGCHCQQPRTRSLVCALALLVLTSTRTTPVLGSFQEYSQSSKSIQRIERTYLEYSHFADHLAKKTENTTFVTPAISVRHASR